MYVRRCVVVRLLLVVQYQVLNVVRVLVRPLRVAIVILLGHEVGIFLHISSSIERAIIVCSLPLVISTVSIAECRFVAVDYTHVELVWWCHVLRIHFSLRAVIRVIYRWPGNPIWRTHAILQVYYGRPRLDIIIIACAPEGNVSPLLHRSFGHRTVVYIAVSVEWGLYLSVGGRVRIVVLTRILR